MDLITVDMETFYDKTYSLSKLTTEEYIRDPRFQTIGLGIKFNKHKSHWFTHGQVEEAIAKVPWNKVALVAHNARFDAAILAWRYGVKPAFIIDTMSMARPFHNSNVGCSLAKLAAFYGLGVKGTEVVQALGKRLEDFTPEELAQYGEYCKNDCDLEFALLERLVDRLPLSELRLIDLTLRMYTQPVLCLDTETIQQEIDLETERKAQLLSMVDQPKGVFSSNDKFAEFLKTLGIEPPTKPSPKKKNPDGTPMQVWAFAKGDADFVAMLDHEDPLVAAAIEVRMGVKSTQRETRAARFMGVAERNDGMLPVPLGYYNAHTGRYGGEEKINLQNLQRTDKKDPNKGLLRKSIKAGEGELLVVEDLSQIEARLLVWQANQLDRVEAFANKRDVYSEQASVIYGREVDRKKNADDFVPGFIGKAVVLGCFTDKTMILSNHGWKQIVDITLEDLLWDGSEWVQHLGVVEKGEKEVVRAHGLEATFDHLVMTKEGWREWGVVSASRSLFQSALSLANLPSSNGENVLPDLEKSSGIQSSDAHAGRRGQWPERTWLKDAQLDAGSAEIKLRMQQGKSIGVMQRLSPMTSIAHGFLTVSRRLLAGAKQVVNAARLSITRYVESGYIQSGQMGFLGGGSSFATLFLSMGGMIPSWRSIASTTTATMNRGTCDSSGEAKTQAIAGTSESCKSRSMTYDIAYAGPRNRFTVATDAGPVIVHNCGFGLGFIKFASMIYVGMLGQSGILFDGGFVQALRVDPEGFIDWLKGKPDMYEAAMEKKPLALTVLQWHTHLAVAQTIISTFRAGAPEICAYWAIAQRALHAMLEGNSFEFGGPDNCLLRTEGTSIILPNGMPIQYEGLERDEDGQYSFLRRKEGRIQRVRTYGGSVVENVTQALARIVITDVMLKIDERKWRVALQVHDEIVTAVPIDQAKFAQMQIRQMMKEPPAWAVGLPLDSEGSIAERYGDAKG